MTIKERAINKVNAKIEAIIQTKEIIRKSLEGIVSEDVIEKVIKSEEAELEVWKFIKSKIE
jgi:hypothetical protein